jgi:thioredoxin-like negative regulator of GroEL
MPSNPEADVVAGMKALQSALGDNDLAKQVYADASASDRQTARNHFEARMEYVRQVAQSSLATGGQLAGANRNAFRRTTCPYT